MSKDSAMDAAHVEDPSNSGTVTSEKADLEVAPVVDKYGFPLIPQPSVHKDDPLVST